MHLALSVPIAVIRIEFYLISGEWTEISNFGEDFLKPCEWSIDLRNG